MIKLEKGLFSLSRKPIAKDESFDILPKTSFQEYVMVDWKEEGWKSAKDLNGGEAGLQVCIAKIHSNHREILRRDEIEQETAKKPYKVKLQERISQSQIYKDKISKINTTDIPTLELKIQKLKEDIREIKKNPDQFIGDKVGKAGFVIGLIILTFLTTYLFVFYSSASYSAFFKEFSLSNIGVASSIFDPQAFSKALEGGVAELLLIVTIPAAFMGLGYLIHKFQEEKGWKKVPKIGMLILVTFIFDCILAYEITHKIYDIKRGNSFQAMEEYNLSMAFQAINFWLIIFAGFVVYLIWGLVFDFSMEAYGKLDKISVYIKQKQEEIKEKEGMITKLEDELNKLTHLMAENDKEAEKLKVIITGTVFRTKELENSINQFLQGWLTWLTGNRSHDDEKNKASDFVKQYLSIHTKPFEIINQGSN